ncbi:MAG: cytochrome c3 family protein [Candidatus Magnetomorum sp.]|nr:cytochrome c3 family protein [Candidatus Magnetomorum sp.]
MIPKIYSIVIAITLVLYLSTGVLSQEDMLVIDNRPFADTTRPNAIFQHDVHNEKAEIEDCATCHHVYDEDKGEFIPDQSSEDQRCYECHDLKETGKKPGLMKAFHLKCKRCHQEQKKGPLMCGDCHRK